MYYFPQTLTKLNLYGNEIGNEGAKHLANALQQNKVTSLVCQSSSYLIIRLLFSTDADYT